MCYKLDYLWEQHSLRFHVDDVMYSHQNKKGSRADVCTAANLQESGWTKRTLQVQLWLLKALCLLPPSINTKEQSDIMMVNVPNAFIQTKLTGDKIGDYCVIMKITGVLVVDVAPKVYGLYVIGEKGKRVLYVQVH
jgi:hypothetical protein